jgi:hypothetical protein
LSLAKLASSAESPVTAAITTLASWQVFQFRTRQNKPLFSQYWSKIAAVQQSIAQLFSRDMPAGLV